MEGSAFWKGEKGNEVAVNASTGARFESQCAIGGLWIGPLELESCLMTGELVGKTPSTASARQAVVRAGAGP